MYNLVQAATYLNENLSDQKSVARWTKYLKENPSNYLKQHGVKILYNVTDGELYYTEVSLRVFIKLMGNSKERQNVNAVLRAVDKKPKRKKNPSVSKKWEWDKNNKIQLG